MLSNNILEILLLYSIANISIKNRNQNIKKKRIFKWILTTFRIIKKKEKMSYKNNIKKNKILKK